MRKTGFALAAGLLVLSVAAGGWAAEAPSWQTATVVEEKATVEAIDQSTRMVTLKGSKGDAVTFKAGEHVKNLAQVKVGDTVKFAYYESVAVRVLKTGEPFPPTGESTAMARSKPGETPAGAVGKETIVNATITAIDKKAKKVTLKGENGKSVTVTPRRPEKLDEVKVGDRIAITYTEVVAVSLEKAEKK
jgi:Cu/Ag efflux protein CusF